MFFADFYL